MKILLASGSARRKELLTQLGYEFEVVAVDCDEVYPAELPTEKVAGFLAELKAKSFRPLQEDEILITADTVVTLGHSVLGKPRDREEALDILQKLSGKIHKVYTGVTIRTQNQMKTEVDFAKVHFEEISAAEAQFYFDRYLPLDKAGSYGIQEWLGMAKISKIEGSFYTIMGLPTHLLYRMLQEIIQGEL